MSELKVKRSTVELFMLCLSFYEFNGIPHMLFLAIKYSTILYLIALHIKECKQMRVIVASILLYGGITFVATLLYQDSINTQAASFVYMLHILCIYTTTISFARARGVDDLIRVLAGIFFLLLLATDVPMLFINYNFSDPSEIYLIGNKFNVSYLHCFVTGLFFCISAKSGGELPFKNFQIFFWFFSILICARVTCTTGILICLMMGVMTLWLDFFVVKKVMSSPKIIVIVTAIINILTLGSSNLLNNPYVADFIYNVLGKGGTWIGRLNIYKIMFGLIEVHPWIGYGYFSNAVMEIMGFGNPQNGVLKILLDSGILGLIGYTSLIYESMKDSESSLKNRWPLMVFVYCMIIAAIAEINLTEKLLFLTTAIIFCVKKTALPKIQT